MLADFSVLIRPWNIPSVRVWPTIRPERSRTVDLLVCLQPEREPRLVYPTVKRRAKPYLRNCLER